MTTRRALVVEDLDATRHWLTALVAELFPGMAITAVGDLASGLAAIDAIPPDSDVLAVALVDLGLPDGSGIDLIRVLAERHPRALPIVTTIYDDDGHLFEAIAAGAQGYLLKSDPPHALKRTLRRIEQGEPPLSPSIARRMMAHFRKPAPPAMAEVALTPRETEVLTCLGLGMRIRDAARELSISDHTVGDHVKAIYRKLNIATRAEAAVEAVRRGLV